MAQPEESGYRLKTGRSQGSDACVSFQRSLERFRRDELFGRGQVSKNPAQAKVVGTRRLNDIIVIRYFVDTTMGAASHQYGPIWKHEHSFKNKGEGEERRRERR